MPDIKQVVCYTDGSCILKKGGKDCKCGGAGVYFPGINKKEISRSYTNTTNQQTELRAAILGIKKCIAMHKNSDALWKLTIYTDSLYTIKCATEWGEKWILWGWRRKVGTKFAEITNLSLVKELYRLSHLYPVKFVHVRGHQKEPLDKESEGWKRWAGNNEADRLAVAATHKVMEKNDY